MEKYRMKPVNVRSLQPIELRGTYIRSITNEKLYESEIYYCISRGAHVEEIIDESKVVALNYANYNKDNSGVTADTVKPNVVKAKEVKTPEPPKVDAPVPPAPKAEPKVEVVEPPAKEENAPKVTEGDSEESEDIPPLPPVAPQAEPSDEEGEGVDSPDDASIPSAPKRGRKPKK